MSAALCSCGVAEAHVIARKQTFDGVSVALWSDGNITGRLGMFPPGLGSARNAGWRALRAARLAWGEIELYDWSEVPRLVKAARRAFSQPWMSPECWLRATMRGERFRPFGKHMFRRVRS